MYILPKLSLSRCTCGVWVSCVRTNGGMLRRAYSYGTEGYVTFYGGGSKPAVYHCVASEKRSFTSFPRRLTLDIISTLEGELRLENWGLKGRGDQRDH
jgi:hypothetical protein